MGFFGYDTVRYIEPHLGRGQKPDPIGGPDILLLVSDELVVFDNLAGRLYVVIHVDPAGADAYARGERRLDELVRQLGQGLPARPAFLPSDDLVVRRGGVEGRLGGAAAAPRYRAEAPASQADRAGTPEGPRAREARDG